MTCYQRLEFARPTVLNDHYKYPNRLAGESDVPDLLPLAPSSAMTPKSEEGMVPPPVSLTSMPQLIEARCLDDDWTGLQDRAERRKRQNRLNVRAHRKRKVLAVDEVKDSTRLSSSSQVDSGSVYATASSRTRQGPKSYKKTTLRINQWNPDTYISKRDANSNPLLKSSHHSLDGPLECFVPPGIIDLAQRLGPALQLPRLLPLSVRDLLPLIQYNLLRAAISNALALSLDNLLSQCSTILPSIDIFPAPAKLPPALLPTKTQQQVPHDPRIDLIPSPVMRDNAIRYSRDLLHSDFIRDAVGQDLMATGQPMLIVWTDPWDPAGWEMTEVFLQRWGFLVQGCHEMFAASNRWRAKRGERPLVYEVD